MGRILYKVRREGSGIDIDTAKAKAIRKRLYEDSLAREFILEAGISRSTVGSCSHRENQARKYSQTNW
jgi:hypothetical protein